MLARLALVLALCAASASALAQARSALLVLHVSEPSLGADRRAWLAALRAVLPSDTTHVRPLDPDGCWPEDAPCAARYLRSAGADRILLVRVLWERAGCDPMHDASGAVSGHRMLRAATLDLTLIDAEGHTLGHETRPARAADAAERRAALSTILTSLGARAGTGS